MCVRVCVLTESDGLLGELEVVAVVEVVCALPGDGATLGRVHHARALALLLREHARLENMRDLRTRET